MMRSIREKTVDLLKDSEEAYMVSVCINDRSRTQTRMFLLHGLNTAVVPVICKARLPYHIGKNRLVWSGISTNAPVAMEKPKLDLTWLFEAMSHGPERSGTGQITKVVSGLNSLLKERKFDDLSMILLLIPTKQLSPELMLALLRVTFAVRTEVSSWYSMLTKVRNELEARNYPAKKMLAGLL